VVLFAHATFPFLSLYPPSESYICNMNERLQLHFSCKPRDPLWLSPLFTGFSFLLLFACQKRQKCDSEDPNEERGGLKATLKEKALPKEIFF